MALTTDDRRLDHTGLNLIRIVIGSYFMAIALGLIEGVDAAALLRPLLPARLAELGGTTALFALSTAFMAGVALRPVALTLALDVLLSSVIAHILAPRAADPSHFWRDLALASAVLLSYAPLRQRDLRRAALILRHRASRIGRGRGGPVRPRRVGTATKRRRPAGNGDTMPTMRPVIAPTGPIRPPRGPFRGCDEPAPGDRDDAPDNIFRNI